MLPRIPNMARIRWPDGVVMGGKIWQQHDMQMLASDIAGDLEQHLMEDHSYGYAYTNSVTLYTHLALEAELWCTACHYKSGVPVPCPFTGHVL